MKHLTLLIVFLLSFHAFSNLTIESTATDSLPPEEVSPILIDENDPEPDPVKKSLGDKIIDTILESNNLVKQAIVELTYMRCKQFLTFPGVLFRYFHVYGKGSVLLNPTMACNKSSVEAIKSLDYYHEKVTQENGQSYILRIAFKNKLLKLITEQSTNTALKNILSQMKTNYFSLYDSVFDVLKTKEKTLEFLAVLLQDFSEYQLHLQYLMLEKSRNKLPATKTVDENLELLEQVLSRLPIMNQELLVTNDQGIMVSRMIHMYSPKSPLNFIKVPSLAYHYWVPSYVAFQLSRKFGNSDVHSYLAAFSFNYFYEILFREDLKLNSWSTIKNILSIEDPLPNSIVQAYDIYLAHEGAFFAMDYLDHKWSPEKFVNQLMKNPTPAYKAAIYHIWR